MALFGLIFVINPTAADDREEPNRNWPQWRGPLATGVAPEANPPVEWSEKKNIRWKVALPGKGHSTPIVWGDRVFVTTAVSFGEKLEPKFSGRPGAHDNLPITRRHKFVVLAIRRTDGKMLWEKTLHEGVPHEGGHSTASLASASPVTDGEHLFVFFGSYGLYALDFESKLLYAILNTESSELLPFIEEPYLNFRNFAVYS